MEDFEIEFQSTHLQKVSRSFAFCIAQLSEPLRGWVGLSYLLCRILDTVEDAEFSSTSEQIQLFESFRSSLLDSRHEIPKNWSERFPSGIAQGELDLLNDAGIVMTQFHQLPDNVKEVIRHMVMTMIDGMERFVAMRHEGVFRLANLSEVRAYCYVVAGVVGEALTRLLALVTPTLQVTDDLQERARHFGEFLQKVNILKDQPADELQNRFLVPDRAAVWKSAQSNAEAALSYLEAIPLQQIEFRRFCAWSLFLGLETLKAILERGQSKVSQDVLAGVLGRVENALTGNGDGVSLRTYFEEISPRIWLQNP